MAARSVAVPELVHAQLPAVWYDVTQTQKTPLFFPRTQPVCSLCSQLRAAQLSCERLSTLYKLVVSVYMVRRSKQCHRKQVMEL